MKATDQPDPIEAKLLGILEAIRSLTPPQRRRLMRRLRVSGLLVSDEYVSDRNRLRVAPALSAQDVPQPNAAVDLSSTDHAIAADASHDGAAVVLADAGEEPSPQDGIKDRSSAIEMDEPTAASEDDVETEPSLDGPVEIVYNSGRRGGPEQGFGSYSIRWPGDQPENTQLRFGEQVSADEAEYDTLIAALEAVTQRLTGLGIKSTEANLDIHSESPTVIEQLTGQTEIDDPALQLRCDRVRFLLRKFGTWGLHRNNSASQDVEEDGS